MPKLLLVGGGVMGGALLQGWFGAPSHFRAPENVTVIEPNENLAEDLRLYHGVNVVSSLDEIEREFHAEILLFAVKPQALEALLPLYAPMVARCNPLVLSIAAGKTVAYFRRHFNGPTRLLRAMPNLCATIGQGMTVLFKDRDLSEADYAMAEGLFRAVGKTETVTDESLMHAATAISGSGPAYLFYYMEKRGRSGLDSTEKEAFGQALTEAGNSIGLPPLLSQSLAEATVAGAIACIDAILASPQDYGPLDLPKLRKNVTSPGGTTEAAITALESAFKDKGPASLMKPALPASLTLAAKAAAERSRELSE